MYDDEGTLFMRMSLRNYSHTEQVPYFELPAQFYKWVDEIAPKMVMEIHSQGTRKMKSFDRKLKNEAKK